MANPIIDRLVKLCKTEETFIKARALWKTAELKTGPGSGYSIGDAAVGLPAICAFIASQQYVPSISSSSKHLLKSIPKATE